MKVIQPHLKNLASALLLPLFVCSGCSSGDFGTVTGTVTADGKPLPNAMVSFIPQPDGRASAGMTGDDGSYELIYTQDQKGAKVGEHKVQITTAIESGDYGSKAPRETLPAKYNVASELIREVKPGRNVFDFELDYKGKVIQSGY